MTGHEARLGSFPCDGPLNQQAQPVSVFTKRARLATCLRSKRISDLLVGVQHNSDFGADGTGWQVLDELCAHLAALSV